MARPPKKRRWALGQGIYADAHGITVQARIGSGPNARTSPPVRFKSVDAEGLPYSKSHNRELVECYLRLRATLVDARADAGGANSLGAAFSAFLAAHPVIPGDPRESRHADYASIIGLWQNTTLVTLPVMHVPRRAIVDQLDAWTATGRAPSTVNRRKQVLTDVLRGHLEPDADGVLLLPTDHIPDVPPRRHAPRGIDLAIVARILSHLPDRGQGIKGQPRSTVSHTKIRLTIEAWTGMSHKSLLRLERARVNFQKATLYLPPRKKGKGAQGVYVDLLPPVLEALRQYHAAHLWGKAFSRLSVYKSWQRAVKATRAALVAAAAAGDEHAHRMREQFDASVPAKCKPYDLRHSFGTDAYKKTGDIYAVKALMQHADIKTTERYIEAAVPERVARAIDTMRAAWFPEAPKPAGVVRDFQVVPKTGA